MVTGASTANLALLLVDARKGVLEQTRRHALLSSLLRRAAPGPLRQQNGPGRLRPGDLRRDPRGVRRLRRQARDHRPRLRADLGPGRATTSSTRSENMPWFDGQPLLGQLEDVHIASDRNLVDNRFPVQTVIRPQSAEHADYRGYAGSVVGGIFKQGDEVMVLPSRKVSTIAQIDTPNGAVEQAFPPMAVTMLLDDELDISRGDMICRPSNQPTANRRFEAMVCWFDETSTAADRGAVPAQAHDPLDRGRSRGAALRARTSTPCTATSRPRRSRSTTSAGSRSTPTRRSSSTSTGSTGPPAASSSSTPRPTSPSAPG